MPKGDYQRKLRRVDYSKKEIAERLFCAENTVDSRIKQFVWYTRLVCLFQLFLFAVLPS